MIYTAHWDHFGIGVPVNGDTIYHGAVDNATGIAGHDRDRPRVRGDAGRAEAVDPVPRRDRPKSRGCSGSGYYAANPLYPLAKTLGVVNMDALNVLRARRRTSRSSASATRISTTTRRQVAAEQGRVIRPDPTPEKGGFYRSDHFPFAKQGVPALGERRRRSTSSASRPAGARSAMDAFTANDYHKPSDEVRPDWDMSGAVQDLQYLLDGRLPRGAGRHVSRSGSRAPSSRRSVTRC